MDKQYNQDEIKRLQNDSAARSRRHGKRSTSVATDSSTSTVTGGGGSDDGVDALSSPVLGDGIVSAVSSTETMTSDENSNDDGDSDGKDSKAEGDEGISHSLDLN